VFAYQARRGAVEVAFTDRHGALRGGPSASLDLADPRPDSPDRAGDLARLEENLDLVGHALARGAEPSGATPFELPVGVATPTVVRMRQVHGSEVHTADHAWLRARPADPPVADGLVTANPGVVLVVRVADCVPVLLADVERAVVGVAHAGRAGLVSGIVPATLARMRDLGADRVVAWVGPHVCGRCYEVPAQMRDEVEAVVPEAYAQTSWGTPAVDVGAGVAAQLLRAGIEVIDATRCTMEDQELYSYRRDGVTAGRMGGLVWVRP